MFNVPSPTSTAAGKPGRWRAVLIGLAACLWSPAIEPPRESRRPVFQSHAASAGGSRAFQ